MQLATIKAKSEALRLRQEYELGKFRQKYAPAPQAVSANPAGTMGQAAGALGTGPFDAGSNASDSDHSLSIGTVEAFDEPLKVFSYSLAVCGLPMCMLTCCKLLEPSGFLIEESVNVILLGVIFLLSLYVHCLACAGRPLSCLLNVGAVSIKDMQSS
jgi:hypothetical protein